MTKPLKKFDVNARLLLLAGVTIAAESFEDALEQAKTLRETDFVKFKGDFVDGSISIQNVSRSEYWSTEQE